MPPTESQQRCVAFVCYEKGGTPQGTTFVVGLPAPGGGWLRHFVTAAHVVRDDRKYYVRLRRVDGGQPEDVEVDGWVPHGTSDLAAAPCDVDLDTYSINFQEEEFFADKHPPDRFPAVGDDAYFIGLLANVEAMGKRGVPMVRAGSIGALYVDDVPMTDGPAGYTYTRNEPSAHLLDCYSRGGFSGCPVYVDYRAVRMSVHTESGTVVGASTRETYSALLGVLVGHFGGGANNAGVAVVVPLEALRELLDRPELVEWQQRKGAEMAEKRQQERDENAAVLDSVNDDAVEPDRISLADVAPEDALRALLKTPPHGQMPEPQ